MHHENVHLISDTIGGKMGSVGMFELGKDNWIRGFGGAKVRDDFLRGLLTY